MSHAALLLVLGALLMLFSPSVEIGLIAFALGVALELAGLVIERRDRLQSHPGPGHGATRIGMRRRPSAGA